MSQDIYGDENIAVSEIIGRTYNNPLGPAVLETFVEHAGLSSNSHVLDLGSGRGLMAVELARLCGCAVTGIERSEAMWKRARRLPGAEHVRFLCGDALSAPFEPGSFDAVMSFDVFGYFKDRAGLYEWLCRVLRPAGIVFFTDYHIRSTPSATSQRLVDAWGIVPPESLQWHRECLVTLGFQVLELRDTTTAYREHWVEMHRRTLSHEKDIMDRCGWEAFTRYLDAVEAILAGVDHGGFGHFLCAARCALSDTVAD